MKKPSSLAGKKALVVDDEPELRKAIIFDLKRRGCETYEAGCGDEAIKIVQAYPIDIVLSDVRMPNGNGVDLLKQIRKLNPDIPIVLLATGFADLTESDALRMGAYALLEKPLDRRKLYSMLEEAFTAA